MAGENDFLSAEHPNRRRLLSWLSGGALATVAGCGGSGTDDPTTTLGNTTTATPAPTATTTTPESTTASTTTAEPDETSTQTTQPDVVHDVTFRQPVAPPAPTRAQYNVWNSSLLWKPASSMDRFHLLRQSMVDLNWYPEILKDWNYNLGVFEAELYDDHYWAATSLDDDSHRNVTAKDWITRYKIGHFIYYPYPYWPYIERTEQTGKYSFRVFFDDTYRQDFVLRQNLHGTPPSNTAVYGSWIERFEDATSADEIEDIDDTLYGFKAPDPNPFITIPFKVTGATENAWQLELRDDEDPMPRWVDETNFRHLEFVVSAEPARARQGFVNGNVPFGGTGQGGVGIVDADVDFSTTTVDTPVELSPGAYGFNFGKQPSGNVHFRRAFAYMLDRATHKTRFMDVDRIPTGLMTPEREETFITADVLDACTTYGPDSVLKDLADAEMAAGGYERDSEGNWLYKEGDRAGQPMRFTIPTYPAMQRHANNATQFRNEMSDWGIDIETVFRQFATLWDDIGDGAYEIALAYWGGGTPTVSLDNSFYSSKNGGVAIWEFPGQWDGPPVGQPGTPPADAPDETVTYGVANQLQRLQLVRDPDAYKEALTRIAWIFNQSLPLIPIGHEPNVFVMNTDAWSWPVPVPDHPFAWDGPPSERIWNRGVVTATPE